MVAPALFIVLAYFLIAWLGVIKRLVVRGLGAVGGIIIGLITEYYTGGAPVENIAKSGETGPATVMITGLAMGMQSVVIPDPHHLRQSSGCRPSFPAFTG